MLIEAKMLRRAINGELRDLMKAGLVTSILRKPYDEAFERVLEFYRKHYALPGQERLKVMCANLAGFVLPSLEECPDKATVYWEQLGNAVLDAEMAKTFQKIADEYNQQTGSPAERMVNALSYMRRTMTDYGHTDSRVYVPCDLAMELWEKYQLSSSGNRPGIPIDPNFPTLVDGLVKWAPGNITTFISRSGIGKTWMCLINALYALKSGVKVLIASMEMTAEEIMERLATLAALVNYDAVLKGTLQSDQLQRYQETLAAMHQKAPPWDNLFIINPDAIRNIEIVEAQADSHGASLVVADAFYDFPEEGQEKRWEKINENLRLVRTFSLATKRHWFLTAQFNRSASGTWGASDFNVGGSDYFNQVSNNVIFLIQRPTEKKDARFILKLNKGRNASVQPMMTHNWNFKVPIWTAVSIFIERDRSHYDKRDIC